MDDLKLKAKQLERALSHQHKSYSYGPGQPSGFELLSILDDMLDLITAIIDRIPERDE